MKKKDCKLGMRVVATEPIAGWNLNGQHGTVVAMSHFGEDNWIGVEFDTPIKSELNIGHSCSGRGKEGRCRYGDASSFKKGNEWRGRC